MANSKGTLRIKWVISDIACTRDMRQTIRGLGLRAGRDRGYEALSRSETRGLPGV